MIHSASPQSQPAVIVAWFWSLGTDGPWSLPAETVVGLVDQKIGKYYEKQAKFQLMIHVTKSTGSNSLSFKESVLFFRMGLNQLIKKLHFLLRTMYANLLDYFCSQRQFKIGMLENAPEVFQWQFCNYCLWELNFQLLIISENTLKVRL